MRVPAILLMGIVLSACVSSSKRRAIPARSASQSRVDTGSTSRAPGRYPGGPLPGYTRHITYSDGRFTLPDGSTVPADPNGGFHDLHRSLYSTRRSRRNHSPERGAMHFGQCAGLLLPLRPPSSLGCFRQAGCSTDSPPPA